MLNLLSNAVKFTEQGEVVLTVTVEQLPDNQAELTFAVRDTGIGLSTEGMSRLFQSFSQADSSTTRKYGGTGLGLAISKRLSELMGGRMWAESGGTGKGSTFSFSIKVPVARMPATRSRDFGASRARGQAASRRRRRRPPPHPGAPDLQSGAKKPESREALRWIGKATRSTSRSSTLHTGGRHRAGRQDARTPRHAAARAVQLARPRRSGNADELFNPSRTVRRSQLLGAGRSSWTHRRGGSAPKTPRRQRAAASAAHPAGRAASSARSWHCACCHKYRADLASNGIEAVESVERQTYDVILMDVQMPEMDGLEASRRITTKWSPDERPRIVAMTANAMQGDREMCLAAGMDDYLTKPIRVDQLVEALNQVAARNAH
jgi:CheY-like chemotaxis protein